MNKVLVKSPTCFNTVQSSQHNKPNKIRITLNHLFQQLIYAELAYDFHIIWDRLIKGSWQGRNKLNKTSCKIVRNYRSFSLKKKKLHDLKSELTTGMCCLPHGVHGLIAVFRVTEGMKSILHPPADVLSSLSFHSSMSYCSTADHNN